METTSILGRGNAEGARLVREWFADLNTAADLGDPAAYVFVMGSIAEILRCFDFPIVFPEINSIQTAVRHVAHEYLTEAEDYGYSPDICGYVKADVAVQLRDGGHPMGRIPKPALAIATNACNTYVKWAEIWERLHGTRMFTLDIPGTREDGKQSAIGSPDFERDRRYIETQLRELIPLCEEISGKKFDIDRLREVMGYANRASVAWKRVLELNRARPPVFNALTDGTVYLGISNGLRGTREGAEYMEQLVEELELKVSQHIGTVTDDTYRLAFVGVPCYPIFRRFSELFGEWGGVFVSSTYLWFASGGSNVGFEYDLEDPIASLASGVLVSVRDAMDSMFHHDRVVHDMIEPFNLDGVVYHPIKSCRTVSTGMADGRRMLKEMSDIPSLFIESDMMDRRVVSEAQLKNRADAFFEGLAARRHRSAATEK
ncbi:MAG: 2-hydroxyacyl-CoA dehydratase subunit D [Planctomycetota bacterium]|jgi:benzoyl-CoA reductase subunit B